MTPPFERNLHILCEYHLVSQSPVGVAKLNLCGLLMRFQRNFPMLLMPPEYWYQRRWTWHTLHPERTRCAKWVPILSIKNGNFLFPGIPFHSILLRQLFLLVFLTKRITRLLFNFRKNVISTHDGNCNEYLNNKPIS